MRTFAYCCASFEKSVAKAAGIAPLCSPPTTAATLPNILRGFDF
jgi:hypothetical protein